MTINFAFKLRYKHFKNMFANLLSFITSVHESFYFSIFLEIHYSLLQGRKTFYENLGTRCKNDDMKQHPYCKPTNFRRRRTKFCGHNDLPPGMWAQLQGFSHHSVLYTRIPVSLDVNKKLNPWLLIQHAVEKYGEVNM